MRQGFLSKETKQLQVISMQRKLMLCLIACSTLVDIAIGLRNFVPIAGQASKVFWEFKLRKNCNQSCSTKTFFRHVEMTFGLVRDI